MSLLSTDMHEPFGDDDPSKNNKPYGKVILTLFPNYKQLFQNCNCVLYGVWFNVDEKWEDILKQCVCQIYCMLNDFKRFWDIKPISQRHWHLQILRWWQTLFLSKLQGKFTFMIVTKCYIVNFTPSSLWHSSIWHQSFFVKEKWFMTCDKKETSWKFVCQFYIAPNLNRCLFEKHRRVPCHQLFFVAKC